MHEQLTSEQGCSGRAATQAAQTRDGRIKNPRIIACFGAVVLSCVTQMELTEGAVPWFDGDTSRRSRAPGAAPGPSSPSTDTLQGSDSPDSSSSSAWAGDSTARLTRCHLPCQAGSRRCHRTPRGCRKGLGQLGVAPE